jgi:hypothetical protein
MVPMTKSRYLKPDEMPTTRVPARFCPVCFIVVDAATCFTAKIAPEPGDFTVCINCGAVLLFDGEMDLLLSSLEAIPMHSRLDFAKMVTAVKERGPFKNGSNNRDCKKAFPDEG